MAKIEAAEGKLNWIFFCPGCGNYHGISTTEPHPCWTWNGSVDKPTFSPSLLVTQGPKPDPITHLAPKGAPNRVCHSFIRDGQIQYLNDCTHELAGKTIDMEEVEE